MDDATQGYYGFCEPAGSIGLVIEDVHRPLSNLGVDFPQEVEQLQLRAFFLKLLAFGKSC